MFTRSLKKKSNVKKNFICSHSSLPIYKRIYKKIFKEKTLKLFTLLDTLRIASLNSPIKRWLTYQNGKNFFSKDLYFQLNLVFHGIFDLMKLKKYL